MKYKLTNFFFFPPTVNANLLGFFLNKFVQKNRRLFAKQKEEKKKSESNQEGKKTGMMGIVSLVA